MSTNFNAMSEIKKMQRLDPESRYKQIGLATSSFFENDVCLLPLPFASEYGFNSFIPSTRNSKMSASPAKTAQ